MMPLLLGYRADTIDEIKRLSEIRELKLAMQVMFVLDGPLRDALVYFLKFFSLKWRNASTARDALFVGKFFSHDLTSHNDKSLILTKSSSSHSSKEPV